MISHFIPLLFLIGNVWGTNTVRYHLQYSNMWNYKCINKSIALSALKCSLNQNCVGFKFLEEDDRNLSVKFLFQNTTFVIELKQFLDRNNSKSIFVRSDIVEIFPKFLKWDGGKIVSKYENVTLKDGHKETFAKYSKPLNYSFNEYEKGFYIDKNNYFNGLIKLSELTYNYPASLMIIVYDGTDTIKYDVLKFNSYVKAENNYKLDTTGYYVKNSRLNLSPSSMAKLNAEFGAFDTSTNAATFGFGFWFGEGEESNRITRMNQKFIRHAYTKTEHYEITIDFVNQYTFQGKKIIY
ncbi:hypothetical protein SNEBB_007965 [Seison nebaliae]|nr:hypothetical protein SNEBB_007965 [Seison nebaliae]